MHRDARDVGGELSYIVAARAAAGDSGRTALRQLLDEVRGGKGRVVSITGMPDSPRRAVIAVDEAVAESLRGRFAGSLIIEPDLPLTIH